jgi:hypothetical protein
VSRIRSIHPGLFTDEDFVCLSDGAQIFYIGLLTEADDQGVFEWKPLSLKMRLRAATNSPVDDLLGELIAAEKIAAYEIDGRKYGAIRNFRKFQRPKSPNAIHPLPPEWGNYVGLTQSISEIDGEEKRDLPLNGEKEFQMEDGGGRRKERGTHGVASSRKIVALRSGERG